MTGRSERELVQACLLGDGDAWDELFDRHYAATSRFVFQLAPDFSIEDIEEICQETFLNVIRHLAGFDFRSQLQTWIFRIAANKSRDVRAKAQSEKRGGKHTIVSLDSSTPDAAESLPLPSEDPTPDAAILSAEQMALLRTAIDHVGQLCREVIELRYFGDLSYEEIASTLRLHPKTVSSRLSKCLQRLAQIAARLRSRESSTPFSV